MSEQVELGSTLPGVIDALEAQAREFGLPGPYGERTDEAMHVWCCLISNYFRCLSVFPNGLVKYLDQMEVYDDSPKMAAWRAKRLEYFADTQDEVLAEFVRLKKENPSLIRTHQMANRP